MKVGHISLTDRFTKIIYCLLGIFLITCSLQAQILTPLPLKLRVTLEKYGSLNDFAWFDKDQIVFSTESGLIFSNGQDSIDFIPVEKIRDQANIRSVSGSSSVSSSLATLNGSALMVIGTQIVTVASSKVGILAKLSKQLHGCHNQRIFSQDSYVWVVTDCGTEVFTLLGNVLNSKLILSTGYVPFVGHLSHERLYVVGPRSVEVFTLTSAGLQGSGVKFQSRNRLLGATKYKLGLLIWTSKSIQVLNPDTLVRTDLISLEFPVGLKEVLVGDKAFLFRLADESIFKADQLSGRKLSSRLRLEELRAVKTSPDGTKTGVLVANTFKFLSFP